MGHSMSRCVNGVHGRGIEFESEFEFEFEFETEFETEFESESECECECDTETERETECESEFETDSSAFSLGACVKNVARCPLRGLFRGATFFTPVPKEKAGVWTL